MENQKKYWCFSCNKECQIIKAIEEGDEVYQCSNCKNTFVEEIENDNKQTNSQSQNQQQNQPHLNINIRVNSNRINNNNIRSNRNTQNNQNQDQYGMDNTLLFLPSTVNYVQMNNNNFIPSMINSIGSLFSNNLSTFDNILNSLGLNNPNNGLISFLNNHNNDFQFNNLVNILMSFDLGSNRHPPASERAIQNLKTIEVKENNINEYKNITCNMLRYF